MRHYKTILVNTYYDQYFEDSYYLTEKQQENKISNQRNFFEFQF